jgi:hypothetical protein
MNYDKILRYLSELMFYGTESAQGGQENTILILYQ